MTIVGEVRKVHRAYRFLVEVDGIGSSKWTTCSELSAEAEDTTLNEGGDPVGLILPGRISLADITLTRGVADYDVFEWFKETYDFVKQGGTPDGDLLRNLEIIQLDRNQDELLRWAVYQTWCKKFKAGEWDNGSSDPVMEECVLKPHGFDKVQTNA